MKEYAPPGSAWIVTSALEDRSYHGTLLGIAGTASHRLAVLVVDENRAVTRHLSETEATEVQKLRGQRVIMESGQGCLNVVPRTDCDIQHRRWRGLRR